MSTERNTQTGQIGVAGPRVAATNRPWLVFTSAGDTPNCAAWLREDRSFDLWVVHYGDRPAPVDGSDLISHRKGSKFQNLWHCHQAFPEILERYDAVLVMDDDIEIDAAGIEALFRLREREGLLVVQPAFDPRGRVSHRVTLLNPLCEFRRTTFIEVTCPLFQTDVLVDFLRQYDGRLVGWGVDEWFSAEVLRRDGRGLGIVDAVPALNPHEKRKAGRVREIDLLQRSRDRRLAWEAIAAELGVASTSVKRTTERRWLPVRPAVGRLGRSTPPVIAAHVGLTQRRVIERVRHRVARLLRRGLSQEMVGQGAVRHFHDVVRRAVRRRTTPGDIKVMVVPRDPNPYQESLYRQMREAGVRTHYLQERTPSGALNLLLLPLEVMVLRVRGWRTLHLHWVYGFGWPGGAGRRWQRRVAEAWFDINLSLWRALGIDVYWTAHNALPHEPVFADDLRARRRLGAAARCVFVHQRETIDELRRLGVAIHRSEVVPMPAYLLAESKTRQVSPPHAGLRLLFFGLIRPYKGVEVLLEAMGAVDPSLDVKLRVAGVCSSPELSRNIADAVAADPRISVRLERISDDELADEIAAADFVVVPGTRITNSSTVVMALGAGRPVVVSDIPAFAALPELCAARFDGTVEDLASLIETLHDESSSQRSLRAEDAVKYAAGLPTWEEFAAGTLAVLSRSVGS